MLFMLALQEVREGYYKWKEAERNNYLRTLLLNFFPNIKTIYFNIEAAFYSATIISLLKNQYDINIFNAPI